MSADEPINLFEAGAAARRNQEAPSGALLTFKAGKCNLEGNLVTPLAARGRLSFTYSDDNLLTMAWTNRESGTKVDEFIVFPGDAKFSKIEACTTGRVYVLRFTSGRKELFWMQEPDADADVELITKANDLLTNPPPEPDAAPDQETLRRLVTAAASGSATPAERAQLQRLMMEAQARRAAAAAGPPAGASPANRDSVFRSALSSVLGGGSGAGSGGAGSGAAPTGGSDVFAADPFAAGDYGTGEDAELQAAIQASLMEMQNNDDAGNDDAGNDDGGNDNDDNPPEGDVQDMDDDE